MEQLVYDLYLDFALSSVNMYGTPDAVFVFDRFDVSGARLAAVANTFLGYTYECIRVIKGVDYCGFITQASPKLLYYYMEDYVFDNSQLIAYHHEYTFKVESDAFYSLSEQNIRVRCDVIHRRAHKLVSPIVRLENISTNLEGVKAFYGLIDVRPVNRAICQ